MFSLFPKLKQLHAVDAPDGLSGWGGPNSPAPNFECLDAAGFALDLSALRGRYYRNGPTRLPLCEKALQWGCDAGDPAKLALAGSVLDQVISSAPGQQGYLAPEQAAAQFEQTQDQIDHLVCDPAGVIGRLYAAQTTPHVYLIDPSGRLIYQGAIDSIASTRARDVSAAKNYLMAAFQQSRRHQKVDPSTTTPYGCSVKYVQPK